MIKYIKYNLLSINGTGHQPGSQAALFNVTFDGGFYVKNGVYFGYLEGEEENLNNAINGMKAFGVVELTVEQAKSHVDNVLPVGSKIEQGTIDTATVDTKTGRIVKTVSIEK